jgi:hypothetical protein
MLLYDGDVYSVPKVDRHWCKVDREKDVYALNDMIFLKARENIYFQEEGDFSLERFDAVADRRVTDWHRGRILVPVREEESRKIFVEANKPPEEGGYVVATSQQHPKPRAWPSVLSFRQPATVYGNGSAMGYVRKKTVPPEAAGVVKIRV